MITVQLNRADFEYDIHSLAKAFFPSEDVVTGVGKIEAKEEISFSIAVDYFERSMRLALYEKGDALWRERTAETDFSNRKETKNILKRELYLMLSEYCGKTLPWGTLTGIRPTKIPMEFFAKGADEAHVRNYMKETYFTSDEKISLGIEVARRERKLLEQIDYENGYSLYIGIPFCPSTCLYCSFTSFPIGMWENRVDEYLDALEKEIDFTADYFRDRRLNAVYVGGGTPTTLSPAQMERLLGKICQSFDFSNCLEFTVEAGRPDSITEEKLVVLKERGVSRISINPQTMNDQTLKIIGRRHTVREAEESFRLARKLGFGNINMDLIVGLPGEGLLDVEKTLRRVSALAPDNLTVHSLAVKRAARLKMDWEKYQHMTFENTEQTIGLTAECARKMGLFPYYLYRQKNMAGNFENVGYASPGKEGIYNVLINEEVQDIVALGAGSITKRVYPDGNTKRCENVKNVAQYIDRIGEMIERKKQLLADG